MISLRKAFYSEIIREDTIYIFSLSFCYFYKMFCKNRFILSKYLSTGVAVAHQKSHSMIIY